MTKWRQAFIHAWPSLTGFIRILFYQPSWGLKLLAIRVRFFLFRRLPSGIETPDGFRIETPSELISYWAFFVERECWLPEWGGELKQGVNSIVLDVGANAGVFSHWIWRQNPSTELIAFEPLPKMAEKIKGWQIRTGAKLKFYEAAVSDHCGEAVFFTATDNDTNASLRPNSPKSIKITVPLITLDSVVPDRAVLLAKIDVEGCESDVLLGGVRTLANIRFLLIEAHTQEAFEKIRARLPASTWDYRKVASSDFLFTRRENS